MRRQQSKVRERIQGWQDITFYLFILMGGSSALFDVWPLRLLTFVAAVSFLTLIFAERQV